MTSVDLRRPDPRDDEQRPGVHPAIWIYAGLMLVLIGGGVWWFWPW